MKNYVLLMMILFCLVSCENRENSVTVADPINVKAAPSDMLLKRIDQTGDVSFKSWNGNLRGLDNDDVLHFYKESKVVLERMGVGVNDFKGTYSLTPDGRVVVDIKGIHEPWPPMILRADGSDLLLYREDGHTSWWPPGDRNLPDPHSDGFWPFRAK